MSGLSDYQDEDGYIVMCRKCRTFENQKDKSWIVITTWYVRAPGNLKMTMCPKCSKNNIQSI